MQRAGFEGVLLDMMLRTCAANGGTEADMKAMLEESPGPKPEYCEHCGTQRKREIMRTADGEFVAWYPISNPCTNPACIAIETAKKAAEDEAKRQAEKQTLEAERKKRGRMLLRDSGIPMRYQHCRLREDPECAEARPYIPQNGSQERALTAVREYADAFRLQKTPADGLYIAGPGGTGKTHLASALAREVCLYGRQVVYTSSTDLLDAIKATYDGAMNSAQSVMDRYKNADLLVIDDIGKEISTPWAMAVFANIVHSRYDHVLPIVVTTNFTAADLQIKLCDHGAGDHAASIVGRIEDSTKAVAVVGQPYRRRHDIGVQNSRR